MFFISLIQGTDGMLIIALVGPGLAIVSVSFRRKVRRILPSWDNTAKFAGRLTFIGDRGQVRNPS